MNAPFLPPAPLESQAKTRLMHLEMDNAAEFNARRSALLTEQTERREALRADWLNLSAADFLAKYPVSA